MHHKDIINRWYSSFMHHEQHVRKYEKLLHHKDLLIGLSSVSDPDPHTRRPPRSGSAWTDADPDREGDKLRNKTENCCYEYI